MQCGGTTSRETDTMYNSGGGPIIETAESDYDGGDNEDGVMGNKLGEENEVPDEEDKADNEEDVQQDGNNSPRINSWCFQHVMRKCKGLL